MLTPEELSRFPDSLVKLYQECEDEILQEIGKRIAVNGKLSNSDVWKLRKAKESKIVRQGIESRLRKYSKLGKKELRKTFKKAGQRALLNDSNAANKKMNKRSKKMNEILNRVYDQTNGTMQNWTRTSALEGQQKFVHALDKAMLNIQSGTMNKEQAIRKAIEELADHMNIVKYEGHNDTLEVAVRRAVVTGVNQLSAELTMQYCLENDIEFVETSAHSGARVSKAQDCTNHAWWQGKIYHIGRKWGYHNGRAYPPFNAYQFAGYGYGEGICGWNCRHSFRPFIFGKTKRRYTQKELNKLNSRDIEYQGKKYTQYEIDQKQRYIERQIRKYKRRAKLEKESGLDDSKALSFVKKWQKKLREFVKVTGNRRDYFKEWINKQSFKSRLEKWVDKHCVDVTAEYMSDVVPNYAEPLKEKNYTNDTSTESDEKYAKFIQEKLGGIVEMRIRGGSDYNWNYKHQVKQWEKKAPTKIKSISNRVRDGYRQLKESSNPGGLFFDLTYLQDATHRDGIWKTLSEIEQKGGFMKGTPFDIVFSADDEVIIIYRIKK